jgi:hypothetical protein
VQKISKKIQTDDERIAKAHEEINIINNMRVCGEKPKEEQKLPDEAHITSYVERSHSNLEKN